MIPAFTWSHSGLCSECLFCEYHSLLLGLLVICLVAGLFFWDTFITCVGTAGSAAGIRLTEIALVTHECSESEAAHHVHKTKLSCSFQDF